jgi:hypothetical protein
VKYTVIQLSTLEMSVVEDVPHEDLKACAQGNVAIVEMKSGRELSSEEVQVLAERDRP